MKAKELLGVPYIPEDKNSCCACGPACLRMVFAFYDVVLSQEKIAIYGKIKIHKINAKLTDEEHEPYGASNPEMLQAVRRAGFRVVARVNAKIKDIRRYVAKGWPVIVNWMDGKYLNEPIEDFPPWGYGHYSVVIGFGKETLILHDPNGEDYWVINVNRFTHCWYDPQEKNRRWMIAIGPLKEGGDR